MKILKDFLDKGAKENEAPKHNLKGYLSILGSGLALIIGLNEQLVEFFKLYATFFPLMLKFIPFLFLSIVILLLYQVFTDKIDDPALGKVYKYANSIRQISKGLYLFVIGTFIYSLITLSGTLKPIDQPIVLFVKDREGQPIPELNLRILNENQEDITQGAIETSTVDGMALLTANGKINGYSYIQANYLGTYYTIPMRQIQAIDTTIFKRNAYSIIVK